MYYLLKMMALSYNRVKGVICNWYDCMLLFQDEPRSHWFLFMGIGVVFALIIGLSVVGRKRES